MKRDYNDYPIEELMKRADAYVAQFGEGNVDIHFKFTCEKCGERCMFEEPNKLFERGDCHKCGHSTVVKKGGFAAVIKMNRPPASYASPSSPPE
jgi:hypothetical protein